MKRKYQRKIILINPNFQLRFILASSILLIFTIVAVYVTIQYFFVNFIELGIHKNLYHDHEFFKVLAEQQLFMNKFIFIIAGVLFAGTIVWALYFSHRIAGPMYKLNKHFSDANKTRGIKIKHLFFRKHDFFHEVPQSINLYLAKNDLLESDEELNTSKMEENSDQSAS